MTKKLRAGSDIYIAPGILGRLDKYYNPIVRDERTNSSLDPIEFPYPSTIKVSPKNVS